MLSLYLEKSLSGEREREREQVNRMYLPIWSNWLKTPIFAVTGKKSILGLNFGPKWP